MNTRLELTWLGKYDPENKISPEPRILIENPEYSYVKEREPEGQMKLDGADAGVSPTFDNLLIHGDNLLALKSLEQEYAGRVKCIYIDPPYNTGSAFEHYDDNLEHSTWLSLMKPRLELLHSLLDKKYGSIWISIDDDERDYLKVLCDEVFGRSQYITSIVWQKRYSPDARTAISDAHEYILCYAMNPKEFKETRNLLPLTEDQKKQFSNPDHDPRGPWKARDFTAPGYRPNQMYEITLPSGRVVIPPGGRCWRVTKAGFNDFTNDNRMDYGKDGDGVPRVKRFLSEMPGIVPWSWWNYEDVGHSQEGKKESIVLFGTDEIFATPKPERLIQRIIHIATNPGDLVLDSFLGSGTTAAVAHKMGRRWIGVELGDHAYTHCAPRMKKVIDGEQSGISKAVGWKGGGGFRFCELAPSLLQMDKFGRLVISEHYNAAMLAAAMAKHEGYAYCPDPQFVWKQGASGGKNFIFTTTQFVDAEYLQYIAGELPEDEYLLICAEDFAPGCDRDFPNITVRPIPKILLGRCEFGRDNYDLNVILQDEEEWEDEEIVNAAGSQSDVNEEGGAQDEKNG